MSLLDDFKTQGAAFRLTEEMLFAEVYREMEAGIKRDGLWAMALAESKFDESTAKSLYIKYRVQSLKDEIRIADLGKTGNPAPTPKQLPPAPVPRHNKKIDKDLTCNIPRQNHLGQVYAITDTCRLANHQILAA